VHDAFDNADGERACSELFTPRLADLFARGARAEVKTCPHAVADSLGGKRQADIVVKRIAISGDTATVDVVEGKSPETWRMVRQDARWRLDAIVFRRQR
jgi:hypothetical protein